MDRSPASMASPASGNGPGVGRTQDDSAATAGERSIFRRLSLYVFPICASKLSTSVLALPPFRDRTPESDRLLDESHSLSRSARPGSIPGTVSYTRASVLSGH